MEACKAAIREHDQKIAALLEKRSRLINEMEKTLCDQMKVHMEKAALLADQEHELEREKAMLLRWSSESKKDIPGELNECKRENESPDIDGPAKRQRFDED